MNSFYDRRRRRSTALLLAVTLILTGALGAFVCVRSLYPIQYCDIVERYCSEYNVDTDLAYAVIHTESGFDPGARSNAGAIGLMQIMPETFLWLQSKLEPDADRSAAALYEPEINIRYGIYFLSMLHDIFQDDVLTVAAYHAGQNRVRGWLNDNSIPQENCTPDDIPSSVTGHYVRKVQNARSIYKKLYG